MKVGSGRLFVRRWLQCSGYVMHGDSSGVGPITEHVVPRGDACLLLPEQAVFPARWIVPVESELMEKVRFQAPNSLMRRLARCIPSRDALLIAISSASTAVI